MKKIISLSKNLFISFSISLTLITLTEVSFRTIKVFKSSFKDKFTLKNKREKNFYEARFIAFDKEIPISTLIKRNKEVGDHLKYEPWIQIGNFDHSSSYSKVVSGTRETIKGPDLKNCKKSKVIWIFGGSTTYGVGVPSYESIPSEFSKIGIDKSICIDVSNFGVPYHYSKQETMHFINKLFETELIPDIAIFVDGFNDFWQPGSSINGEPFFTPRLKNFIGYSPNPGSSTKNSPLLNLQFIEYLQRKLNIIKSNKSYYKIPEGFSQKSAAIEIKKRLLKNTYHLGSICKAYKVKCYRFLQPVAAVEYKPPLNDVLTSWLKDHPELVERFSYGYKLIKNSKEFNNIEGIKFYDISGVFKNYSGIPYIDAGHYSPRANKDIAREMFKKIGL